MNALLIVLEREAKVFIVGVNNELLFVHLSPFFSGYGLCEAST